MILSAKTNMEISSFVTNFREDLISYLSNKLKDFDHILKDGVIYAVSKGKRIRPLAVYLSAKTFGGRYEDIRLLAFVVELIHSYSLVHDDLPAMDNDDYRRGELTVHKKYGHAQGILIGDLLLSLAGDIALEYALLGKNQNLAVKEIFKASEQMVEGQFLEFSAEINEKTALLKVYQKKTTALIKSALLSGGVSQGCSEVEKEAISTFGDAVGTLFQITDDFFDLEQDMERGIKTLPVILGKENTQIYMEKLKSQALSSIEPLKEKHFLTQYFNLLINRTF